MQTYFPSIYGNADNRQRFGTAVAQGTLSHAYIMEGPDGCGKRTFATEIAAALACIQRGDAQHPLPCRVCPTCRKILAGNSPDVTYVRPDGASIGVDEIKRNRSDMHLSSSEESHKVYIIEDAHTLTPQAQNALLIALEEPPTDLLIFLLTNQVEALLSTVRSRAQLFRMSLLNQTEMESALSHHPNAQAWKSKTKTERDILLKSAAGNLGVALELLDAKKKKALLRNRALVEQTVEALTTHTQNVTALRASANLPTKRTELSPVLTLVADALRDLLLLTRDENCPLCFYIDRHSALQTARNIGTTRLMRLCDAVAKAQIALAANANVSLTLITLFAGS